MNILLVGKNSHFMRLLVEKLNKEGHRIFLLTEEPKTVHTSHKIFETYHFSYGDTCIREVLSSIQPDAVIFMGAYDYNFRWSGTQSQAGEYTSGLMNILLSFQAVSEGRFIYLSSEEVYQQTYSDVISEDEPSVAISMRGLAIAVGESICKYHQDMGKNIVTLRLDHLYGIPDHAEEAGNICARMCIEALETGEILVDEEQKVALLHVGDAVEFIYQVLAAPTLKSHLYQISSGEPVSQRMIAETIASALGGKISVEMAPEAMRREPILSNERYQQEFGIRIFHTPQKEIAELARHIKKHSAEFVKIDRKPRGFWEKFCHGARSLLPALVPFIENCICFIPFFMLNNRAVGREYFQNIDFYLLYVLLFAIVHGQQQAIFSSLLAVCGYCFRQMYHRSGFDVMLDYNTYIWIAQLLILGLVVGYMRDRLRVIEEEEQHEVNYLSKQIDDISDINMSNMRVKELLSNQIINQSDSFGKLYEITSSLDQYEPSEVLFYAAEVLARLMGSRDVAIYTVANRSYARLFSATSAKARCLGNSINYPQMEEMYAQLKEKKVYINKSMDERYPLMANAIYAEDEIQLILMVWGIPWERMTLGQANMLTVIGYLIQNAVLRANRYMSALQEQRYIEGTNILEPEAFRSLVKAYLHAREKQLTECTLIQITSSDLTREEAGQKLAKLMRQSDYVGVFEDGRIYALLANTSAKDAQLVEKRFREEGFQCEIQEDVAV